MFYKNVFPRCYFEAQKVPIWICPFHVKSERQNIISHWYSKSFFAKRLNTPFNVPYTVILSIKRTFWMKYGDNYRQLLFHFYYLAKVFIILDNFVKGSIQIWFHVKFVKSNWQADKSPFCAQYGKYGNSLHW